MISKTLKKLFAQGWRKGFSMIDLSIVILVIGILIAGFLAFRTIISKFRIVTAQTRAILSPVNGIGDSKKEILKIRTSFFGESIWCFKSNFEFHQF